MTAALGLPQRIVALDAALAKARIPHAFGGAIALAYCTLDPRGTSDIDLNVFLPAEESERALQALPDGIEVSPQARAAILADGQARLWWDEFPVDLFFDYAPIHADAAAAARRVPFEGTEIPILGPVELVVFKAMFDRTRDWADIEAALRAGTVDLDAVRDQLARLVDLGDHRFARLTEAERLAGVPEPGPG